LLESFLPKWIGRHVPCHSITPSNLTHILSKFWNFFPSTEALLFLYNAFYLHSCSEKIVRAVSKGLCKQSTGKSTHHIHAKQQCHHGHVMNVLCLSIITKFKLNLAFQCNYARSLPVHLSPIYTLHSSFHFSQQKADATSPIQFNQTCSADK
jgi:hypothetical protein